MKASSSSDRIPPPEREPPALAVPAARHLDEATFRRLNATYHGRYGFNLVYADPDGNLIYGLPDCGETPCRNVCRECRKQSTELTLQHGTPQLHLCQDRYALWGVPVMHNQQVLGSLVVAGASQKPAAENELLVARFAEASKGLLELAVEFNLTNADHLDRRRQGDSALSPDRPEAPACPTEPSITIDHLKVEVLPLEAKLAHGILHGIPDLARDSLRRIQRTIEKHAIPAQAPSQGFFIHLLSVIFQRSHEVCDEFSTLLAAEYQHAEKLLQAPDQATRWSILAEGLETVLDLVARHPQSAATLAVDRALSYIENHFDQHQLNRAEVARHARVSESHLSRLIRQRTGQSFSELLNRHRIERSAQLLLRTDLPLLTIALEVGFSDQSYFGRVFRKRYGLTPDQYRHQPAG